MHRPLRRRGRIGGGAEAWLLKLDEPVAAPSDLAAGFAGPAKASAFQRANRRCVIALAARDHDLNARLRKSPIDDCTGCFRRVFAMATVRKDAEAEFDGAARVWRSDEADVADNGHAVALNHQPDTEALGLRRRRSLKRKHIQKIGQWPLRRQRRANDARRLLPIIGEDRGGQGRQWPQLNSFSDHPSRRHSTKYRFRGRSTSRGVHGQDPLGRCLVDRLSSRSG